MSRSVEELAKQLKSMPRPAEEEAGRMWDSGDNFCEAITLSLDSAASGSRPASESLQTIMQTGFAVEVMAYRQGQVDERVRLLRAMYLIAIAAIQGKPEPSDAEIAAMQAAPLMDESKIPAIFRKDKPTQTAGGTGAGSAPRPSAPSAPPSSAAPPPPSSRKPWWRFW